MARFIAPHLINYTQAERQRSHVSRSLYGARAVAGINNTFKSVLNYISIVYVLSRLGKISGDFRYEINSRLNIGN